MDMGLPVRYILLSLLVHGLVFVGLAYRPGGREVLLEVKRGPESSRPSDEARSSPVRRFQVLVTETVSPVRESHYKKFEKKGENVTERIRGVLSLQARELARNRGPVYPRMAVLRSREGVCVIEMDVLSDGRVGEVNVIQSSGYTLLDDAAREAAASWRFTIPGNISLSESVKVRQRIVFRLE